MTRQRATQRGADAPVQRHWPRILRSPGELAHEAADERALTGPEREQFIRDCLDAEEDHQQAGREHAIRDYLDADTSAGALGAG